MIGQLLSLLATGNGVFATLLGKHTGKDVSSTLTAGAYYILSATIGPYIACKTGFVDKIRQHWWKFLIIGLADVYGTYLQTLGYKYTSVASNEVHPYVCLANKRYSYSRILQFHYTLLNFCY